MATDYNRRITECERNSMDETTLHYLTRHVVAHGQIEDHDALRDLMVASLPDHIRPVWHAMRYWYTTDGKKPSALDQQSAHGIPVVFPSGKKLLLQYTLIAANFREEPMLDLSEVAVNTVSAVDVLGEEKATQLEEWCVTACQIAARVHRSWTTACSITSISSTVGQLHRMCPDLVRYVFPQTAKALETQVRRSPLPDEWMNISRSAVADMVNHLALCYILPECKRQRDDYRAVLDSSCWAFDSTLMRFASWASHRHINGAHFHSCSGDGNWKAGEP